MIFSVVSTLSHISCILDAAVCVALLSLRGFLPVKQGDDEGGQKDLPAEYQ